MSDAPITAKNPWDVPGKPQDVKVIDWDKDHMDLEWKPPISVLFFKILLLIIYLLRMVVHQLIHT